MFALCLLFTPLSHIYPLSCHFSLLSNLFYPPLSRSSLYSILIITRIHAHTHAHTHAHVLFSVGCRAAVDLVFMLDASSSVGEADFQSMLRFVVSLVQDMHINMDHVRVGLLSFSTEVFAYIQLKEFSRKERLLRAISSMPYIYGSTNMGDGFRFIRRCFL